MAQRAVFMVVESPAPQAGEWFAAMQPQARSGKLLVSADAQRRLCDPAFVNALCNGRSVCAVGGEWLAAVPRRFNGVAVAERKRGWKIAPRASASRITALLRSCDPLEAPARLLLNEPWDVFALWLAPTESALPVVGEHLQRLLSLLTPDIAVCGVLLGGPQASRWSWRSQQAGAGALPTRPAEDIPPTLLKTLGIGAPLNLPGTAVDFGSPEKASGYTLEEEREIQKRLEDLGYL